MALYQYIKREPSLPHPNGSMSGSVYVNGGCGLSALQERNKMQQLFLLKPFLYSNETFLYHNLPALWQSESSVKQGSTVYPFLMGHVLESMVVLSIKVGLPFRV